jgi:hypothetical protein
MPCTTPTYAVPIPPGLSLNMAQILERVGPEVLGPQDQDFVRQFSQSREKCGKGNREAAFRAHPDKDWIEHLRRQIDGSEERTSKIDGPKDRTRKNDVPTERTSKPGNNPEETRSSALSTTAKLIGKMRKAMGNK